MRILLLSDIHGNYPALKAVADYFAQPFDLILNGGDTTVYAPFDNQTIDWLRANKVISILGNTDNHVLTLLSGETFKKPRKAEKRIMYGWTAAELTKTNCNWLKKQLITRDITVDAGAQKTYTIGMFHGSPENPDEFLFIDTPEKRFEGLAASSPHSIITVGHSHSPFHKCIGGIHFINPGSVGRMFDGTPKASCATLSIENTQIDVELFRIAYPVEAVVAEIEKQRLPSIYKEMYRRARKLN
ncbi:MAG: metallophosphoesterase family protein [Desulfobacterales bacterium]|nr:metallophosphatase family protein [Deltaproteobacteria bacterium]NNK94490.1 metallophosphoesterase family protein [Desulfobacterales bacterium]